MDSENNLEIHSDRKLKLLIEKSLKKGTSFSVWTIGGNQILPAIETACSAENKPGVLDNEFADVYDDIDSEISDNTADRGLGVEQYTISGRMIRNSNPDILDLLPIVSEDGTCENTDGGVIVVDDCDYLSPETMNAFVNFAAYGKFGNMELCPGWIFIFLFRINHSEDYYDRLDYRCTAHIPNYDYVPAREYKDERNKEYESFGRKNLDWDMINEHFAKYGVTPCSVFSSKNKSLNESMRGGRINWDMINEHFAKTGEIPSFITDRKCYSRTPIKNLKESRDSRNLDWDMINEHFAKYGVTPCPVSKRRASRIVESESSRFRRRCRK